MKYFLIFLAFSATSLHANTYQGKNGKVAHNGAGTAVQTNNGTAVHDKSSSIVRRTNGAYHPAGTHRTTIHAKPATVAHTNSKYKPTYSRHPLYCSPNTQPCYRKA